MTLYTSRTIADYLGLTERRIRQLRDEGVLPEERPGLWELRGTTRRYTAYLRKGGDDLNAERTRLTAEKRKAAERENRIRDGEVHKTEDIERALKTLLLNTRGNLLSLPAKLAPELAALGGNEPEIFERLRRAIREALEDLSDYKTALAAPEEEETGEEETGDEAAKAH